jgi:hypothetical protein
MGLSLTTFLDGQVISASDIRARIQQIEDYVNTGIAQSDLQSPGAWVDYPLIFKPDFYGSPSPRMEMVSGDTWYRYTGDGRGNYAIYHGSLVVDTWIPIPGLSATVRHPPGASNDAIVTASFYGFTIGGYDDVGSDVVTSFTVKTATVALFVGDIQIAGTTREIYALPNDTAAPSPGQDSLFGRVNIGIIAKLPLTSRTANVSVKIKLENVTSFVAVAPDPLVIPKWKHTFIGVRSLVVDVQHLQS